MQIKTTIQSLIGFVVLMITSCGPYQKALKSQDTKLKYDLAEKYYDEGDYRRAKSLFEQLKPLYRGKPQSERITYFYANCLLNTRSYITAWSRWRPMKIPMPKNSVVQPCIATFRAFPIFWPTTKWMPSTLPVTL